MYSSTAQVEVCDEANERKTEKDELMARQKNSWRPERHANDVGPLRRHHDIINVLG